MIKKFLFSTSSAGAPLNVAFTVTSDATGTLTWTNSNASLPTNVYVNGVLNGQAIAGATSYNVTDLTRATNHTFTLKHDNGGVEGAASTPVIGRPRIIATGGTVTDAGGYRTHTFLTDGTFAVTSGGRISFLLVGGGGGGGAGGYSGGEAGAGGGGGGGGAVIESIDNVEPAGSYAVTIGSGGAGGTSSGANGSTGVVGGNTVYRSNTAAGGGYGGGVNSFNGIDGSTGGCGGGGGGGATGGSGASGSLFGGANGYSAGANNSAGGGGGGGAGSAGGNASSSGGSAGVGLASAITGQTYAAGGYGGRGTGHGENGDYYGDAGNGGGEDEGGGNGYQGIAVFRYPI